jgi:hypothetical protein
MERLNLDKVKIMAAAATLAMFAGTACAHLEVYGEVNKVFEQVWAEPQDAGVFADNNYSPSKLGVMSSAHLNKCTTFGGVAELEFIPNNTRLVSQIQTEDLDNHVVLVRKLDSWVSYGNFGTLRLGLGEAASWGITNISYAGTNETSLGSSVANNAGGMIFGVSGATGLTILSPTVNVVFQALNGVGDIDQVNGVLNTKDRVRYDTADWMGFKLGVSYGNDTHQFVNYDTELTTAYTPTSRNFFDVALRYSGCWDDFMVGAGVAGAWYNRDGSLGEIFSATTTAANAQQVRAWSGSIAVAHKPTGINAAVAGGQRRHINSTITNYNFWYVQLGYKFCFTHYGKTNAAVDYFQSKHALVSGDTGKSWGLGVTQDLTKINSAVYASVRNYKYSGSPVNYKDIFVGSVGVQFKFGAML